MQEAVKEAWKYNVVISQVNTDRGSEFFSNQKKRNPDSKPEFEKHLISERMKHIPSSVGNPQTNGKLECHWLEYDRHRGRFNTLKGYMDWYNDQVHDAFNVVWYETPYEAFVRKMRPESMLGLMFKNEKQNK